MDIQDLIQPIQLDKIKTIPFSEKEHYSLFLHFINEREIPFEEKTLPQIGFISFYGITPIAMGFLRKCEGNQGIFDHLIAKLGSDPKLRDLCIDQVVIHILKAAKEIGIQSILAFSINIRTLERALKFGFIKKPHQLIYLNLEKA